MGNANTSAIKLDLVIHILERREHGRTSENRIHIEINACSGLVVAIGNKIYSGGIFDNEGEGITLGHCCSELTAGSSSGARSTITGESSTSIV